MKTSFDIPAPLLAELRAAARAQRTTSKSLVEQALRELLERYREPPAFVLADAAVDGRGMTEEFGDAGWDRIRDAAYGQV